MQLALQQRLVWQLRLVLCDQSGGCCAAEGVFDDFVVFAGAEEHADGWVFVGFADVAV